MVDFVSLTFLSHQVVPTAYDADFSNIGSRLQKFEVGSIDIYMVLYYYNALPYLQSFKIVVGMPCVSIFKGGYNFHLFI